VRRQDGIEVLCAIDVFAHFGEKSDPEYRQRLVIFLGMPNAAGEGPDRDAHPLAGLIVGLRLLQECPRHAEVLAMMKFLVPYFAPLETLGEFDIVHK
jgi:hypothetical protein